MKAKTVTLKQTGYSISGESVLNLWGGGQGTIDISAGIIPLDKLSKENLLKCVNDGRFGCESIDCARVIIEDLYEDGYTQYNCEIEISG